MTDEQQQLLDVVTKLFGKHSDSAVVRASEGAGFDGPLWRRVADLGLPALGVPERVGGSGGTAVDLAIVCEAAGRFLAPVPLVETIVGLRALGRCGDVGEELSTEAVADGRPIGFALRPARGGRFDFVPSGAAAARVVGLDGEDLVLIEGEAPSVLRNLGRLPLAHRSVDGGVERIVLLRGAHAIREFARTLDEWKSLTAMSLVGLGSAALALAVDYARVREQFGVPIGSFQSLAHRLADDATLISGARLLALKSAWAIDSDPDDVARLASMAFCNAAEVAHAVAADAVHVHGGMGFSLEGDAQLFFRRATGWSQVYAGIGEELQHLADVLYGQRAGEG